MSKGTLNKATIIGRLGDDPQVRETPGGDKVANFSVATNETWKGKDGNPQESTEWHRVTAWRNLAEICERYLKKGSRLYLEGRIQTRSWDDKDGVKHYITEIVANSIVMLDSKPAGENGAKPKSQAEEYPGTRTAKTGAAKDLAEPSGSSGVAGDDDDVPF